MDNFREIEIHVAFYLTLLSRGVILRNPRYFMRHRLSKIFERYLKVSDLGQRPEERERESKSSVYYRTKVDRRGSIKIT